MTIKELLNHAIEGEYIDLQALIMFLVLEKKVLDFDQNINELDLYFLEKHRKRMNSLITEYKTKMNIQPKETIYEVQSNNKTYLVKAKTNNELESTCFLKGIKIVSYRPCLLDELFIEDGKEKTVRQLRESNQTILGGY